MKNITFKKTLVLLFLLILPGIALATGTGWTDGLEKVEESGLPSGGDTQTLSDVVFNIMNWMLMILAAVAIIGFVIAAIMYLLSGGDDGRMKTAKSAMIACIIGVLVGLMGLVVIYAVSNILKGEMF